MRPFVLLLLSQVFWTSAWNLTSVEKLEEVYDRQFLKGFGKFVDDAAAFDETRQANDPAAMKTRIRAIRGHMYPLIIIVGTMKLEGERFANQYRELETTAANQTAQSQRRVDQVNSTLIGNVRAKEAQEATLQNAAAASLAAWRQFELAESEYSSRCLEDNVTSTESPLTCRRLEFAKEKERLYSKDQEEKAAEEREKLDALVKMVEEAYISFTSATQDLQYEKDRLTDARQFKTRAQKIVDKAEAVGDVLGDIQLLHWEAEKDWLEAISDDFPDGEEKMAHLSKMFEQFLGAGKRIIALIEGGTAVAEMKQRLEAIESQ